MKKLLFLLLIPFLGLSQWTENFDAGTTLPPGWAVVNGGAANTWIFDVPASGTAQSGDNVASILYDATAHDDYLVTKAITVTAGTSDRISFYVKSRASIFLEDYSVLLSTTDQTAAAFTTTLQATQNAPAAWTKLTFFLSAYVGQTVYVAIRATDTDQFELYADTFVVDAAPTCLSPTSPSATAVTSSGATINWVAPSPLPANGYQVYYSTTNTAPTSTTVLNSSNSASTSSSSALSLPLTGLLSGTTYYVWVRSVCSTSDQSEWTSVTSFTTLCNAVTSFTQNFDSVTAGVWPSCWAKVGAAGGAYTQASTAMSAPNNMYIYGTSVTDRAVVSMSPVSTLQTNQYRLKFNARGNFTAGDAVEVGYLTDALDASTFVVLGSFTATSITAVDTFILNITGVPAGVQTLAFRHAGNLGYSILIDDVIYELVPSCAEPTTLTNTSVTSTSAGFTWTPPVSVPANGYDVYYSTTNTAPTPSTILNSTNSINSMSSPATINGLTPNTTYYVWVRSECSLTDQSAWSAAVTFTTLCASLIPSTTTGYTNDFTSSVGTCWSFASGGSPTGTGPTGTTAYWYRNDFLNSDPDDLLEDAVSYNSYSTNRSGWLKTVPFDLSAGGYRVKFDYGLTEFEDTVPGTLGSDDIIQFVVSQDGGSTWTVLQTWNAANSPSNSANQYLLNLTGYTSSNTVFAFYGNDGTVNDLNDVDFFVDNFTIESAALATSEVQGEKLVKIYPNPFMDVLNISDVKDVASIIITDISGRTVKAIAKPTAELQLGGLTAGMYLVTLKYKDGSVKTMKAIKK